MYVCFPYFPSRRRLFQRRLPFALLYRFRFASSFLSLVPTNVDVPPYKSPEVERLACSNHHPRTGYVVARVRIRSIISNLSLHFSQLSRFTRSSKVPSPSQKKKKNDHITHMYTYISLAALLSPPFVRINEKLSYHRFPSHGGGGEENLKLPTVVPFATPRRPFCHGNNFRPRIIKRLCGANFTSERSRRTNDENTRCGRDRTFPPTRGTTSRVPSSFPKRDLNFTNAAVCRVRPRRTSRCGRGANSPDPSEPNNTEEAYGEPAEILSKLTHSLSLSLSATVSTQS